MCNHYRNVRTLKPHKVGEIFKASYQEKHSTPRIGNTPEHEINLVSVTYRRKFRAVNNSKLLKNGKYSTKVVLYFNI